MGFAECPDSKTPRGATKTGFRVNLREPLALDDRWAEKDSCQVPARRIDSGDRDVWIIPLLVLVRMPA